MTDEAKALEETAKAAGKAIDAASGAGSFLSQFLKAPLEELSGMWTDSLKFRRGKRLLDLQDKAQEELRRRGLEEPTREVPLSFAVPLLEAGSLEEDDELQRLWARLLANAADNDSGMEIRTAYVDILTSFSKLDAQVLDGIYRWQGVNVETLAEKLGIRREVVAESVNNLSRLGCVTAASMDPAIVRAVDELTHRTDQVKTASNNATDGSQRGKLGYPRAPLGMSQPAVRFYGSAVAELDAIHLTPLGRGLLIAVRIEDPSER